MNTDTSIARPRRGLRLIPTLLLAFLLAVTLLVLIQFFGPSQSVDVAEPVATVDVGVPVDANQTIVPVVFKNISELSGILNLTGISEPNAIITIYNGLESLGQVTAGRNGEWSIDIDLREGESLLIELIAYTENGAKIRSDERLLRIPAPVPELTSEDEIIQSSPALLIVVAPGGPSRIIQLPFEDTPTAGMLSMGPIDYDKRGGVIFSGSAGVPGVVRVYAGDSYIGEGYTAPDGRWFLIGAETLPDGAFELRAELFSSTGLEAIVTLPFERMRDVTDEIQMEGPIAVHFELNRWHIRRELIGGGQQWTSIFGATVPDDEEVTAQNDEGVSAE